MPVFNNRTYGILEKISCESFIVVELDTEEQMKTEKHFIKFFQESTTIVHISCFMLRENLIYTKLFQKNLMEEEKI